MNRNFSTPELYIICFLVVFFTFSNGYVKAARNPVDINHKNKISDAGPDVACDEGFSGPDCSFCTWTTAGEGCHPWSPRDLFDIDSIQSLTLKDLNWELLDSQTYNDVTIIKGTFSGGFFDTYTAEGKATTIELHYVAAIYIPEGWPRPGDPNVAYVSAVHYEDNLLQPIAVQIANYFRVPVLHHAQLPRDWLKLDYFTRNEMNDATFANVISNNPCEPIDMVRGQFRRAMAQADMYAITLLQRFAESAGGEVHKVAFRGFSKEGWAGWLAAAVDPRIEVTALGGFHNQNMIESSKIQTASWGCYGNPNEANPNGLQTAGIILDWLMNTPAGAAYINLYDVQHNKDLLYPRFILIDGDVGMPEMHDGSYCALGAETPFLDNFTEIPWRYVRKSTLTKGSTDDDGDVISKAVVPGLLVENLIGGPGSEDLVYPKVISASATIAEDMLMVEATASQPTESMVLWWSWSDDRVWNDPDQAPWVEVHMTQDASGVWTSPPVPVEPGKVVGWYVEARNSEIIGEQERTRTDAGAVHFLRETDPWVCSPEIPDWCGAAPAVSAP